MFSVHRGLVGLVLLGSLAWSGDAHAGSLDGKWKGSDDQIYTFETSPRKTVTMKVLGSPTRSAMRFRGNYVKTGFQVSDQVRAENIATVIPLRVRQQALIKVPDLRYRYDVKEISGGKVQLVIHYHSITHDGTNLTRVNLNSSTEKVTLTRLTGLPDLKITDFSVQAKKLGSSSPYWLVKATIENVGDVDVDEYLVRMLASDTVTKAKKGRPWVTVPNSATSGKLKKGKSAKLEWRSLTPVIPKTSMMLQLRADPDDKMDEILETNNHVVLHRLACAFPEDKTPPMKVVMWAEVPDGPGAKGDYSALLSKMPSATVDQKAEIVLCYMKLEAQRRARLGPGSVKGSRFIDNLTKHYMAAYMANPNKTTGKAVTEALGDYQGWENVGASALYVPKKVRKAHPGMPKWIYPATQFWSTAFYNGEGMTKIPVIDVPFLVGANTMATSGAADAIKGGRNQSQVMHWATGVRYGNLPTGGMHELFIGYELWHLEGWDVFGEDAINDLIAEEQGRMLGARLLKGDIQNSIDLVAKVDADFITARKWVGTMLQPRMKDLDKFVLATTPPQAHQWWASYEKYGPWWKPVPGTGTSIPTGQPKTHLSNGKTVDQVTQTDLVQHLIQIYTLMYETNGASLTPLTSDILDGKYDAHFKTVSKANNKEWELP